MVFSYGFWWHLMALICTGCRPLNQRINRLSLYAQIALVLVLNQCFCLHKVAPEHPLLYISLPLIQTLAAASRTLKKLEEA